VQKYRVFFPGEKEYRYLDRAGVEAHFPEINMRIFHNLHVIFMAMVTEAGETIMITKEEFEDENIPT